MISRRNETLVDQYMALRYYRFHFLNPLPTFGAKVHKFLSDISKVYPGPVSEGMQLNLCPTKEKELQDMKIMNRVISKTIMSLGMKIKVKRI